MKNNFISNIRNFINENKAIIIVIVLLFIERFAALYELGISYNLVSDDEAYVTSGIIFGKTGMISMHNDNFPSAQIMPGMTVLIGVLSLVFGEGKLLWAILKLLWICMGSMTAWFIYKSVNLFTPKWCGIIAVLPLFRPDFVWMDNLILTETPFILFLMAMIYYTLKMGKENNYKNFICCAICYMLALMLKANIAPYPVFALIYLLIMRYDKKLLIKQVGILAVIVLCFVIPWSIRNYIHFNEFIPLTYGAGNPTLRGTYQGINYPDDKSLDYDTYVNDIVKKEYSEYFDQEGEVLPDYSIYMSLKFDAQKAEYRQQVWKETDIKSMLYSYLIIKPRQMINSVFYWKDIFGIGWNHIYMLPYIEIFLCFAICIASIILKKYRPQIFFLIGLYLANIYIYSMSFAFDRYNASVVYIKYIVIGIGILLLFQMFIDALNSVKQYLQGRKYELD